MRRWVLIVAAAGLALMLLASCGGAQPRTAGTARSPSTSASTDRLAVAQTSEPPAPVPLTQGWSFRTDPHGVGQQHGWQQGGALDAGWTPLSIPHDYNSTITPSADVATAAWYRVSFQGPPAYSGRMWAVHFEDVRRNAHVWLNGRPIGSNWDPYAPFSLPATSLRPGASNTLVVRVDNFRGPASLPEDWWNWGGIMGPVTLQPVGRLALDGLGVMPQLSCGYRCGDLLVQGTLRNLGSAQLQPSIRVHTIAPDGAGAIWRQRVPVIPPGGSAPLSFRVPVQGPPALWSPQSPALYRVLVSTTTPGRVEQQDSVRVGMRSVQVRRGILYLNGQRLWLHGASIHEDMAGRGAALTDGDIDTIVSELRSLGANVTRTHYLLSPRLLDALDAAGIMVWSQAPVDHADLALATAAGRGQALTMLRDTILGERTHPSVIVDSVGNELLPTPDSTPGTSAYLRAAIGLARRLDPGIPVALDTYGYPGYPAQRIYSKLDVLGISSYFGWYNGLPGHSISAFGGLAPFLEQSRLRYPGQALVVSEFGAEAFYDGASTVKGTYEFQTDYLRRTVAVLDRLPFMNGAIYWTLREFAEGPGWAGGAVLPPGYSPDMLHHKGLIAYDGTQKPAFTAAEQLLADPPAYAR